MAVDLRSRTTFERFSIVIMPDGVVKLEHGMMKDRVRRYLFARIESVVIWRKLPWIHILVCFLILVLPGLGLYLTNESTGFILGTILALIGVALIAWYGYCGVTYIRIRRDGVEDTFKGMFRPSKLASFRTRLVQGIRDAQPALPPPLARQAETSAPLFDSGFAPAPPGVSAVEAPAPLPDLPG